LYPDLVEIVVIPIVVKYHLCAFWSVIVERRDGEGGSAQFHPVVAEDLQHTASPARIVELADHVVTRVEHSTVYGYAIRKVYYDLIVKRPLSK
jgi:hypothetical protein